MVGVPRRVVVFLVIGIIAASQSANIIRIGTAHPVAIAAWRLILASAVLAPLAGRKLSQLARLSPVDMVLLVAAGIALATHFFAWIAAVQLTTVAGAAVVFAINPVITAMFAGLIFGERVTGRLVISIILGLLGVVVLGWNDLSFAPQHLLGDGLALLCSVLFTVYFLLGKRLRRTLDTEVYVTGVYAVAALFSLAVLLALELPLVAYTGRTWLCFGLMALVPTMIGHTAMNNALRYINAGRISATTLTEPLLAGVVAYYAWGEEMTAGVVYGYALICTSVIVLALDSLKQRTARPGTDSD